MLKSEALELRRKQKQHLESNMNCKKEENNDVKK